MICNRPCVIILEQLGKELNTMKEKVTKCSPQYPTGSEPDYIVPKEYCGYRYAIGKLGRKPLVVICMNPSAARDESSDRTVNRIIKISQNTGMDGWIVFNTYPERATDAKNIEGFDQTLSNENVNTIKAFLVENKITEVWAAWGDDKGIDPLRQGKNQLISMLEEICVKVYYYGTLTKACNPRHPLQRHEKWSFEIDKNYL